MGIYSWLINVIAINNIGFKLNPFPAAAAQIAWVQFVMKTFIIYIQQAEKPFQFSFQFYMDYQFS